MTSLCNRCTLESDNNKTIERSMLQAESLLKDYNEAKTSVVRRMDLFFACNMKPIWTLEEKWANIMFSLGLVKGALDVFTKLGLWENVIICYNALNLKHKVCNFYNMTILYKRSRQITSKCL